MRFEGIYRSRDNGFTRMFEYDPVRSGIYARTADNKSAFVPLSTFNSWLPGPADIVNLVHEEAGAQNVLVRWAGAQAALSGAQAELAPVQDALEFPQDLEALFQNLSSDEVLAPGISLLRFMRRFEHADFSPFAGRQVDYSDQDLSGVIFGAADFRPARIERTKLAYATINRCTFGRQQLAGLDLRNAVMSDMDLSGFDLSGTLLDNAVMNGVKLVGAVLDGASLRGTLLDRADFNGARAAGAVFDGARGVNTGFEGAMLAGASFAGARLGLARFGGATLTQVSFKDALLFNASFAALPEGAFVGADFDNADLRGADFSGAQLADCQVPARLPQLGRTERERTRFVRATVPMLLLGRDWSFIDATEARVPLDAALLSGGTPFRAVQALLPRIDFAGYDLEGADFTGAQLTEARFSRCLLEDAHFENAVLEGADFTNANLEGADFKNAKLQSAVFAQAWMLNAQFMSAALSGANFTAAMLAEVNFTAIEGRNLSGVNFARACLIAADFKGVRATRAGSTRTTFAAACLADADFTGATLTDVMLTDAQLSAGNGTITVFHPQWQPTGMPRSYARTRLLPAQTGADTTCPDGRSGLCSDQRLRSKPVPGEWHP
jgi:uncharacterized protein YjbI with pentapeptide repeats